MQKKLQEVENKKVVGNFNKALDDLLDYSRTHCITPKRLRTSSAYVFETDNYYLLRSYDTIVAVIDKSKNVCYDALRYVYGFTHTSALHISKFMSDYLASYSSYVIKYTYRDI